MHISTLLAELHSMEVFVTDRGYSGFYVSLTLDATDKECRLGISYDTPFGSSVWLRYEDSFTSYPPEKLPEVLTYLWSKLHELKPWEEAKAEEAIGELARAMDRVAQISEDAFTTEQLTIIGSMRDEMRRLSSNALTKGAVNGK